MVLFFSFLGLIVSVLGLAFNVPLPPSFVAVVRATCGILETVSVSTVILCVEPVSGFDLACFVDRALDCLETKGGGGTELVLLESALIVPLSAPFCCVALLIFDFRVRPPSLKAPSEWLSGAANFSFT